MTSREDGSPSWGRKHTLHTCQVLFCVEKMGPLRGDGNFKPTPGGLSMIQVEKMGPLRGDGNSYLLSMLHVKRREDGSPSWGRKL